MLAPISPKARMNTVTQTAARPIRISGKTIRVIVHDQPAPATAAASPGDFGTERNAAAMASAPMGAKRATAASTSMIRVPYKPPAPERFQIAINPMPTTVLGTVKRTTQHRSRTVATLGLASALTSPRATPSAVTVVAATAATARLLVIA